MYFSFPPTMATMHLCITQCSLCSMFNVRQHLLDASAFCVGLTAGRLKGLGSATLPSGRTPKFNPVYRPQLYADVLDWLPLPTEDLVQDLRFGAFCPCWHISSRPLLPYFEGTGAPALSALMSKVQASLRTFLKVHSDSFHAHLFCSVVLGSRAFLNSEYSCYERRYTHFRNE